MKRDIGRVLLAAALLVLSSCTASRKELQPPPPPPPPVPAPAPAPTPAPAPPKIEVVKLQMAANKEFVGIQLRVPGSERKNLQASEIYLVDETTGEKFTVVRLDRIGRLAEFRDPKDKSIHHLMFRNRDGKLKIGSKISVVIGTVRYEHLLIQP
ncbi:MAG: hypothetical protein AB1346_14170 [Thermodesulfobacteriota bacterium]